MVRGSPYRVEVLWNVTYNIGVFVEYNLNEYKFSIKVIKEFPLLISELERTKSKLHPYRHYINIVQIYNTIEENLEILKAKLRKYQRVNKNLGAVNE